MCMKERAAKKLEELKQLDVIDMKDMKKVRVDESDPLVKRMVGKVNNK